MISFSLPTRSQNLLPAIVILHIACLFRKFPQISSASVLFPRPLFSPAWCNKYPEVWYWCGTARSKCVRVGADRQDKTHCNPLDHSRDFQHMLWTSVCLEVLPLCPTNHFGAWYQACVHPFHLIQPFTCPVPTQLCDPWPILLRRTQTLPGSRTYRTCRQMGFRLSPGFPHQQALQGQKNRCAKGLEKRTWQLLCTAGVGWGSAASKSRIQVRILLVFCEIICFSKYLSLAAKLLNVSPVMAGF